MLSFFAGATFNRGCAYFIYHQCKHQQTGWPFSPTPPPPSPRLLLPPPPPPPRSISYIRTFWLMLTGTPTRLCYAHTDAEVPDQSCIVDCPPPSPNLPTNLPPLASSMHTLSIAKQNVFTLRRRLQVSGTLRGKKFRCNQQKCAAIRAAKR